jgi:hypothetical protein
MCKCYYFSVHNCADIVVLYACVVTHTQSQAQPIADKIPHALVATKEALSYVSADQVPAYSNDVVTATDNYSNVPLTTTRSTLVVPVTTVTAAAAAAVPTPVTTPVSTAVSTAAAKPTPNRTIPPAPPLPPSNGNDKLAYRTMIEERTAIALAAAAERSYLRRHSTGSFPSIANSMLETDVAPRVTIPPPPPAYVLKHLLSLKPASCKGNSIWRRSSTGSSSDISSSSSNSSTSSSSTSSSTTSSTSSVARRTRSRNSTSRSSQSRCTRATKTAVAVTAVEAASNGISEACVSSSSINGDSASVNTSPTYSNIAEDTLQRATVAVSETLQCSRSGSVSCVSAILPPPPAEVFYKLINKRTCSSRSSLKQQAQPTAAAVTAVSAAAAAVTPLDDNTAFINSVLARRHTLPTEKLSGSELASIVASVRLTVAAQQSQFNSNAAPTATGSSTIVPAATTATENTVVEVSGNTELAATSESGVSTSTSGPSLAVRSLTSESAAAVQAARSARTSSSSSSTSQTLRRPTRPNGWTPVSGGHGSIDRVLQCEADSHSNIRAYERSMSADVGSTFNAPARYKVDTTVPNKRSTMVSAYSTPTAAVIATRRLNCSDSSDDEVTVHTSLDTANAADVAAEVVIADSVPLSLPTRTSSSLDNNSNYNNSTGGRYTIYEAWAVLDSVGSSSSSGTSCDIVSTPAATTSASAAADTLSSAASKAVCTTDTVAVGADKIASAAHSHTAVVTAATARCQRSRSPARTTGKRAVSPSPTRGVTRSIVAA